MLNVLSCGVYNISQPKIMLFDKALYKILPSFVRQGESISITKVSGTKADCLRIRSLATISGISLNPVMSHYPPFVHNFGQVPTEGYTPV